MTIQVQRKNVGGGVSRALRLSRLNPRSEKFLRLFVHKVNVTALHASSEQDAICLLNEINEFFFGSFHHRIC